MPEPHDLRANFSAPASSGPGGGELVLVTGDLGVLLAVVLGRSFVSLGV